MILRPIGYILILAGIPLTLLLCVPGVVCMALGCLFVIAGKK